jgi:hypothetical protein
MRFSITVGAGLSLLLACVGDVTAQQSSMTCAERAQQIKTAQDRLAEVESRALAEAANCKTATIDRRQIPCMAYANTLALKKTRAVELEALKADPGSRECSTPAGGGRYVPPNVEPNASTAGGQYGSGTSGSGSDFGNRNLGNGSQARSGGMSSPNTRTTDCGSPDCAPRTWKSGARAGNRGSRNTGTLPGRTQFNRSGPTRQVVGRSDQRRRFR